MNHFDTSTKLKETDLKTYVLNKQRNLIANWIEKYSNSIPNEWYKLIQINCTDKCNTGQINATVKEHKSIKKTRLIQAIINQPKEYLSAFVQMIFFLASVPKSW